MDSSNPLKLEVNPKVAFPPIGSAKNALLLMKALGFAVVEINDHVIAVRPNARLVKESQREAA